MLIFPCGRLAALSRPWTQPAFLVRGAMLASVLWISACGGSAGGDGGTKPTATTTVVVPTSAAVTQPASYVKLAFVDSTTKVPINEVLTVSVSGPGAAQVVSPLGEALTQFKTSNGFGTFSLRSTASPSASAPVVLQLGVVSKGYLASGAILTISEAGATTMEIRLVRTSFDATGALTNAAAGVKGQQESVVATTSGALASNSANGSFTLAVPATSARISVTNSAGSAEQVAAPAASISVPAGVQVGRSITSSAGVSTFVPAAAGAVTARVVAFSPQGADALRSFPGGFSVLPSAGGGVTAPSVFQTAGFAAFEFTDSAGNPVDRFSGSVSFNIEAPAATVTPSGNALAEGATIPIWSYDASVAEWKSEGLGTVTGKSANGNWLVAFQATHLSSWNLDYFGATCTSTINITGRQSDTRPLDYQLSGEGGQYWSRFVGPDSDAAVVLARAPADMRVTVTAFDNSTGTPFQVGRITGGALCGATPITLPVELPALSAPRTINVTTTEICADATNRRPLSTYVYATSSSGDYFLLYTDSQGTASITFNRTGEYFLRAYNPRTTLYPDIVGLPSISSGTQSAAFEFTMPCSTSTQPPATGATGGTSGGSGQG